MKFTVVTLFPEIIQQGVSFGVLGQAKNIIEVATVNPRDFTTDIHRTVDDRPFGGGDGMLMLYEPLAAAIESLSEKENIFYLSPQGSPWNHKRAKEFSKLSHCVLISGRYGGIDQRVINSYVKEEISIGDYVLSGGEFAALSIIDSVSRFIPGVLGHENSASEDSFENGLLECPQFTRPRELNTKTGETQRVPNILLGGHHAKIQEWKLCVSQLLTLQKRPDLMKDFLTKGTSKKSKDLQKLIDFYESLSEEDKSTLGIDLNFEDYV